MSTFAKDDCDCIQPFSPDPGKYVVTAWVKEGSSLGALEYDKHALEINTSTTSNTFKASGNIIEGWQRIEGVFDINLGDTQI